jgi:hypothetical protein
VTNVKPPAYIDPDYATPVAYGAVGSGGYALHPSYDQKMLIPGIFIKPNNSPYTNLFSKNYYSPDETLSSLTFSYQPQRLIDAHSYKFNGQKMLNYPFNIGNWVYYEKFHATPIEFFVSKKRCSKQGQCHSTELKID